VSNELGFRNIVEPLEPGRGYEMDAKRVIELVPRSICQVSLQRNDGYNRHPKLVLKGRGRNGDLRQGVKMRDWKE
jgi:hypothetical protein